jgi:hypothetical protein
MKDHRARTSSDRATLALRLGLFFRRTARQLGWWLWGVCLVGAGRTVALGGWGMGSRVEGRGSRRGGSLGVLKCSRPLKLGAWLLTRAWLRLLILRRFFLLHGGPSWRPARSLRERLFTFCPCRFFLRQPYYTTRLSRCQDFRPSCGRGADGAAPSPHREGSRVKGRVSSVEGRGSRVEGRGVANGMDPLIAGLGGNPVTTQIPARQSFVPFDRRHQ